MTKYTEYLCNYLSLLSCLIATFTLHGGRVKQCSMSISVLAFNFASPFLNDKPTYSNLYQ